ncbi:MAG: GGDEF domain-containing protein [Halieaceae bacterium]
MQDISEHIGASRGRLTESCSLLLCLLAILLLAYNLDGSRHQSLDIITPLVAILIFASCAASARLYRFSSAPAAALLCFSSILLFSLSYQDTGIWSPYMLLLPALPLLASMMIGPRAALWTMAIVGLSLLLALGVLEPARPVANGSILQPGETTLRAVIILAGLVLAAWGGWWHARHVDSLSGVVYQQESQDHLTGLANRSSIEAVLQQEVSRASRGGSWLTIIFADIDKFAQFNELFGQDSGDRCLQLVASLLQDSFRRSSDRIGRYGDDEFLAVLPGLSAEQAETLAERLRKKIASDGIELADGGIEHTTLSFGIASMHTRNQVDHRELLELATQTLHRVKLEGCNRLGVSVMRHAKTGWRALEFRQKSA